MLAIGDLRVGSEIREPMPAARDLGRERNRRARANYKRSGERETGELVLAIGDPKGGGGNRKS